MAEVRTAEPIHPAKTPRAAAVAGIIFACLFTISLTAVRLTIPPDVTDMAGWSESSADRMGIALALIPFAGIAFLWFLGVVRDRLGVVEDKFYATVVLGSGLLFLAMSFAAFAIAGGMLASYSAGGTEAMPQDIYLFGRAIFSQIFNIYALKMAAVFMVSLDTLWRSTGVMPRSLTLLTYLLAFALLLSLSLDLWIAVIFPAWVLIISAYILISSFRRQPAGDINDLSDPTAD